MVKSWTRLFLIFGLFFWFFNFSTSSTFEKSANSANTLVKIISLIFKVSGMYPIYHYFRKGENIWRLFAKTTIIFFYEPTPPPPPPNDFSRAKYFKFSNHTHLLIQLLVRLHWNHLLQLWHWDQPQFDLILWKQKQKNMQQELGNCAKNSNTLLWIKCTDRTGIKNRVHK